MPETNTSFLAPGLVIFVVATIASIYVFREYTSDRSQRAMVASFLAGLYSVFIGHWAARILPYVVVGPDGGSTFAPNFDWVIWALVGIGLGVCYVIVNYGERRRRPDPASR